VIRDYTVGQIMDAISAALRDGVLEAAVSLLHMLAVKDPESAQAIYDTIRMEAPSC
jgi:hypothetical protein